MGQAVTSTLLYLLPPLTQKPQMPVSLQNSAFRRKRPGNPVLSPKGGVWAHVPAPISDQFVGALATMNSIRGVWGKGVLTTLLAKFGQSLLQKSFVFMLETWNFPFVYQFSEEWVGFLWEFFLICHGQLCGNKKKTNTYQMLTICSCTHPGSQKLGRDVQLIQTMQCDKCHFWAEKEKRPLPSLGSFFPCSAKMTNPEGSSWCSFKIVEPPELVWLSA